MEDINFKSARKLKDLDASIKNIGEGLCSGTPEATAKPKSKAVKKPSPSVNEMNDQSTSP